jgi:hypothetical protein
MTYRNLDLTIIRPEKQRMTYTDLDLLFILASVKQKPYRLQLHKTGIRKSSPTVIKMEIAFSSSFQFNGRQEEKKRKKKWTLIDDCMDGACRSLLTGCMFIYTNKPYFINCMLLSITRINRNLHFNYH